MTRAPSRALFVVALLVSARASAQAADAPAPGPAPPPAPAPALGPAPAPPPEEVQVHGRRGTKSGQTTFGGQEVRQVPGAFGDAFRVMEALPGVTPLVSGLPFFFVRGAPPGNNGYYIDGVRVPLLYHVGAGPSVIHPGLIERVDFYPGGYPARYGRFAGGILSGETRRPADALHGEGNVRLFDAGALLEAPIADGQGTVLVAGRYSYTAALISLAAPDAVLQYWDYQARATWRLGPRDTIGLFAFGSYDFFGNKKSNGETETGLATQFHRLDARWDHELPNHGKMRLAATLGSDATGTQDLAGVRDRMVGARLYVEQPTGENVTLRGGADVTLDHYDLDLDKNPETAATNASQYPPRNDLVMGLHLDAVIQAADAWEITPGLRVDMFESIRMLGAVSRFEQRRSANGAVPSVDPRLLSRLRLSKAVTLVSTFGISHQPPAFFVPVPGLQLGRLTDGLQTSIQASQGVEVALPWAFTLTPTFFYHRYLGLTDFATTCGINQSSTSENSDGTDCIDKRVTGRTLGFEMLLRRSLTKKLTGWVSYTLSRTTREAHLRTSGNHLTVQTIPGEFDRTHVLSVIGGYDLGRNWRAGGRFFFYTGRPYSPEIEGHPVAPYNSLRLPNFYRVDVRLEKRWRIGERGFIAVVLEGLNVTLNKEATGVKCTRQVVPFSNPIGRSANLPYDNCTFDYIGPITIPSLGVEGAL